MKGKVCLTEALFMDKPSLQVSQQIPQSSKPFCPNVIEDLSLNWCELLRRVNPKEFHKPVRPKGNQSWVFIGKTDVEAETLTLRPPDWRTDSFEKTVMLGKIEGKRRRGQQRIRWLDSITDSMNMNLSKLHSEGQGSLACCSPWGPKELDRTRAYDWL